MINIETKICTKCHLELPATNEYFHRDITSKDGLRTRCKKCVCNKQKIYRETNKDKLNKINKLYRDSNKDKRKAWYEANKDKISEYNQKYLKTYVKVYAKTYYEANKDKLSICYHHYYLNNKERYREACQRRKAKKVMLENSFTLEQWGKVKAHFNNTCVYCGKKSKKLEQDHFIPLTKNGPYSVKNIVPACRACNTSKSNHDFSEWYPAYKYYNENREKAILEYLELSIK